MQNNLPPGWSEDRVRCMLDYCENVTENNIEDSGFADIVKKAVEYAEKDANNATELTGIPHIVVVGCGGSGNNTSTRMHDIGIDGVEIVAVNTDKQDLDNCRADKKILVGKSITRGLGAGGDPDVGRRAAELARDTLVSVLDDTDLVFITAGMGGGTGTGVAPVIAEIARDNGAIVVGIVSMPFRVERSRTTKARKGLRELIDATNAVIVIDNNCLLNYVPNLPIGHAFSVTDQLIADTIKGISETITRPSLINLDYADIRTIMNCGGVAVMLFGWSKTRDKLNDVVREALNHPLLDVDYRSATGCLIHITGGPDLSLKEAEEIARSLTFELGPNANVVWGARIEEDYEGMVRVIAIMTGVESAQLVGQDKSNSDMDNAPRPITLARFARSIIEYIK